MERYSQLPQKSSEVHVRNNFLLTSWEELLRNCCFFSVRNVGQCFQEKNLRFKKKKTQKERIQISFIASDTLKKAICLLHQGAAISENPAPYPHGYTANRLRQTVTHCFPFSQRPSGITWLLKLKSNNRMRDAVKLCCTDAWSQRKHFTGAAFFLGK